MFWETTLEQFHNMHNEPPLVKTLYQSRAGVITSKIAASHIMDVCPAMPLETARQTVLLSQQALRFPRPPLHTLYQQ
jgi:hypothetical protein